jgi:hypothetical protein
VRVKIVLGNTDIDLQPSLNIAFAYGARMAWTAGGAANLWQKRYQFPASVLPAVNKILFACCSLQSN